MKYSRRRVWLMTFGVGLLMAVAWHVYDCNTVQVVLYNDTSHSLEGIVLDVGGRRSEMDSLEAGESLFRRFPRSRASMDLQLYIETEPPLRWKAPALLRQETKRVTLHVGEQGSVIMTSDTLWISQLLGE